MKKWDIIKNVFVKKLIFWGKWLAENEDSKKIIITWWAIPESIVNLKVLKIKSNYIEAQILDIVKKSPLEESELPKHFQVYWWCKWLQIKYKKQLEIKENQVKESLNNLNNELKETNFLPIIDSPQIYWYRNKIEFSFWKYISDKEKIYDDFRFWFHKQWEFDKIINCNYCVLANDEINNIFKEIDFFSRNSNLPTYDQKTQIWFWRHLVVRQWFYTKEIMLIFSINDLFSWFKDKNKKEIINFFKELIKKFSNIKSVYLLNNHGKADIVQWEYDLIYWKATIFEKILNYNFEIWPKSFFQVNSAQAERLYNQIIKMIWKGNNILLDLYAGTGTIWIILANKFKKVFSVEIVKEAIFDAEKNAILNKVKNIEFINLSVESFLKEYLKDWNSADTLIIDPPREWVNNKALENILKFNAKEIIYISCNPASLNRDLSYILKNSKYKITEIIPVDMFPHTHHIEVIVRLISSQ